MVRDPDEIVPQVFHEALTLKLKQLKRYRTVVSFYYIVKISEQLAVLIIIQTGKGGNE